MSLIQSQSAVPPKTRVLTVACWPAVINGTQYDADWQDRESPQSSTRSGVAGGVVAGPETAAATGVGGSSPTLRERW